MHDYHILAKELLAQCIEFNTQNPPGGEEALAVWIAGLLEEHGFTAKVQPIEHNRANIIAYIGNPMYKKLILTGHLDVVAAGDGWDERDPYSLTSKDGRLYGRGSTDMKGGLAAMMAAAIRAKGEISNLRLCVMLAFVADEEVSGAGTKRFVKEYLPKDNDIVIIGEPTQLQLQLAHRGVGRYTVQIQGKQCHAAVPSDGINALSAAASFILEVEEHNKRLEAYKNGILPAPTMQATMISCGVKGNIIPGLASIVVDCRTTVNYSAVDMEESLKEMLNKCFHNTPVLFHMKEDVVVPPCEVSRDDIACGLAQSAYVNTFMNDATVSYFKGCCDMAHFVQGGYAHTLLCGPGSLEQAHTANEYIEERALYDAVDFYYQLILEANKL